MQRFSGNNLWDQVRTQDTLNRGEHGVLAKDCWRCFLCPVLSSAWGKTKKRFYQQECFLRALIQQLLPNEILCRNFKVMVIYWLSWKVPAREGSYLRHLKLAITGVLWDSLLGWWLKQSRLEKKEKKNRSTQPCLSFSLSQCVHAYACVSVCVSLCVYVHRMTHCGAEFYPKGSEAVFVHLELDWSLL